MSGNFGTPRPQPLPLFQAPVHKVTEWRTIQKYHFFEGLSGIIIEIPELLGGGEAMSVVPFYFRSQSRSSDLLVGLLLFH
jgi:hypothetical protein